MTLRQWELWRAKPPGMEHPQWFVLLSNSERLASSRDLSINGLCVFTLRGSPELTDVRLDAADGMEVSSVCDCDFIWVLQKRELSEGRGPISWERQQAIKAKLKEVLRL